MPALREHELDRIDLGDCMDTLGSLPDESVHLIISSPPYNLGKPYEGRSALEIYLDRQRKVLHECSRVLTQGGSIYWQVGAYSNDGMLIPLDIRFFPILEECGLTPRNRIIWVRQHGLHGRNKYSARHETILWFTKGDDYTFNLDSIRVPQKYQNKKAWKGKNKGQLTCNPNGKNPGDIWVFRNVKHNHEEQTIHPCQFPEDMVARMVLVSSNSGEVVFDPYMGTGTVAVVAQEHGRHYLGTELDESYYEVALRRLSGQPDEKGYFPNLKTLRNYAERTGTPAECFTFDAQTAQQPTDRSKSRIFPEQHHREQLESRLVYEEDCFAADRRDESRPQPPAGSEARPEERMEQRSLLD